MAQEFGGGGDRGGASTITQQLVRARLLPTEVVAQDHTQEGLYTRKAMEIIQAFKLTQAFPGEQGKKYIITAYLNEIYYGQKAVRHRRRGRVYFDKNLDDLTVAEAAMLAGIPQRPYEWDPYNYAHKEKVGGKGKGKARRRASSCRRSRAAGRRRAASPPRSRRTRTFAGRSASTPRQTAAHRRHPSCAAPSRSAASTRARAAGHR